MLCRLTFTKRGPMRYLSHLDLMRLMHRAIRRADLPVSFTKGFNPRPRMAILAALPVGVEGEAELMELRLDEPLDPDRLQDRLNQQLVGGVQITSVEAIDAAAPPDLWAHYQIDLPDGVRADPAAADALMAQQAVPVERTTDKGTRTVDVRPFLVELQGAGRTIRIVAKVTPQGTARADAVLTALLGKAALERGGFRIRRTSLSLSPPA